MDEQAALSKDLVPALFDLGVMGIEIPEEHSGGGATFFHAVLAVEALSRVDPSVGVFVDVQNTLCVNALLRWGSADQKKRWLPLLATKTVGAYALSEAGSGSDAFAMATRARESNGDFILSGRKLRRPRRGVVRAESDTHRSGRLEQIRITRGLRRTRFGCLPKRR